MANGEGFHGVLEVDGRSVANESYAVAALAGVAVGLAIVGLYSRVQKKTFNNTTASYLNQGE